MARALKRGYTLVEILVATAIGVLLLTTVLGAFLSSSRLMSWIGTRTDVASSALLGLNALSSDVRATAFDTMTVIDTPTMAMSFVKEDETTHSLGGFVPAPQYTIYWYDAAQRAFMRKTWPNPATVAPLTVNQLLSLIQPPWNGTERSVATHVVGATCVPGTYPTIKAVTGLKVSLVVQAVAPNGQTCIESVSTLIYPRNHP